MHMGQVVWLWCFYSCCKAYNLVLIVYDFAPPPPTVYRHMVSLESTVVY